MTRERVPSRVPRWKEALSRTFSRAMPLAAVLLLLPAVRSVDHRSRVLGQHASMGLGGQHKEAS